MVYERLADMMFGAPGTWNLKRCPNPHCGLAWLDPMPSREEIWKAYRFYYTHQEDASGERKVINLLDLLLVKTCKPLYKVFNRMNGMRRFEKEWGNKANGFFLGALSPGLRLLDVGCGHGDLLARMRDRGLSVEGVDVDSAAIEQAHKKHGLTVHLGRLESLRFPGDSFDIITMNHVIEHVHEPIPLLRECLRVLKPGARLVVATPNLDGLGHRRFGRHWRGLEPPRHLHLFTRKTLGECAAKAGFRSFETFSVPGVGEGIFRLSLELEERATGRKKLEISKWMEASNLKLREYRLARENVEVGEEIFLTARKEE
jgi:2-polyprenyl-3-methyl-5-hydroxy-6-metoxy-1,4-benzoquinol methylase